MYFLLIIIGILIIIGSLLWIFAPPAFAALFTFVGAVSSLIGTWLTFKQKRTQSASENASAARKPQSYDILPISFELWLRQEIPHIDIWLYVVNFEARELVIDTLQIPHFYIQSSPDIDKISIGQEVVVPARHWTHAYCCRRLIDSEARSLEQSLQRGGNLAHPNATFMVTARGHVGRKRLSRDISHLSMNGWAMDIAGQAQQAQAENKSSTPERHEITSPISGKPVKYGSVIKLIHHETGYSLHSHGLNYEHIGTSGQQQVTASFSSDDGDYWIVKGSHNSPKTYRKGEPVRDGDIIRLEHKTTRTNLHSHEFPSPVTSQQEVTAFGRDGIGDTNDNWKVDIQSGGVWLEGATVRLIHNNTGVALHSHGEVLPEWGLKQQEVTGYSLRDQNDLWKAMIFHEGRFGSKKKAQR